MKSKLRSLLPWKQLALASALALGLGSVARAQIQLDFLYDPLAGKTTATYFGNWGVASDFDIPGLPSLHSIAPLSFTALAGGTAGVGSHGISTVPPWIGSQFDADGFTGDTFAFALTSIDGPAGFTADTVIVGSMFWYKDLEALGFSADALAAGAGQLSGPAGIVNWTVGVASAVPEPSTYAILSGAAALVLVVARRRPGMIQRPS